MRDLIFFGYSGTMPNDGVTEKNWTDLMVARTLREHLLRRYPQDKIEIICAWHKNRFVKELMKLPATAAVGKIRQLHYVGHGNRGGLWFGKDNTIALTDRGRRKGTLQVMADQRFSLAIRRWLVLWEDAGLMSGFFDVLPPSKLAAIKKQLTPETLMHIWGCFAGAPTHTFDTTDPYWNLLNAAGAPVPGIARHIAQSLGITVTAAHDPQGIHGMDYWYRDQHGVFRTKYRYGVPQWSWPTNTARFITYDPSGTGNQQQINFLGRSLASSKLPSAQPPTRPPPTWLTDEIPRSRAKTPQSNGQGCSAVPVAI